MGHRRPRVRVLRPVSAIFPTPSWQSRCLPRSLQIVTSRGMIMSMMMAGRHGLVGERQTHHHSLELLLLPRLIEEAQA